MRDVRVCGQLAYCLTCLFAGPWSDFPTGERALGAYHYVLLGILDYTSCSPCTE